MPSNLHELLLELIRNRSTSAADLLRELDLQLPEYDDVRTESADLGDLQPAEYRADLVLFLERESQKKLGVIVEVQLGRDQRKEYSWPAYIANLRARHRCPVCLLVITVEEAIASWARRTIELGPGTHCSPWVLGPSNAPSISGPQQASENMEFAMICAIVHGLNDDEELAKRTLSTVVAAFDAVDADHAELYFDWLSLSVGEHAPEMFEDIMSKPVGLNYLGKPYVSDFARRYVAQGLREGREEGREQGREQGREEGRRQFVLNLLKRRFGSLSDVVEDFVWGADDSKLEDIAERMVAIQSPEQLLSSLDRK